MDFGLFKDAVSKQFDRMKKHELFRTGVEKDLLWETYLGSFPAGSNPMFKERTEHDCNCCRSFIRAVGNTVAIIDGKVVSIWDVTVGDPNYQAVANALSAVVKASPINNSFLHYERTAGVDKTFQQMLEGVKTWRHFFVNLPAASVKPGADIPTLLGDTRALHDVLSRSLQELTNDAVSTVLDLIAQNSLYRGAEHKATVDGFKKLKKQWAAIPPAEQDAFVWMKIKEVHPSICKIRNSAIGTLLVDLSEGRDLEAAVASFEQKVAPTNYRRPTAVVTKSMIEAARKKLDELGLTSALERRYANLGDITINNLLFANSSTKKHLTGDVFDTLITKVPINQKALGKVEEVSIDKFLADVLPTATSLELLVENGHAGNFVSLIAPVDATANNLFKWPSRLSWSYANEVADSVKERVKAQGGDVNGVLRASLSWFNGDDLDIQMIEPGKSGYMIYFGNRSALSPCGGRLDVDMNCGRAESREAVENIVYKDASKLVEGVYTVRVNNYCKRETVDVGFIIDLEYDGVVTKFHHVPALPNGSTVTAVQFKWTRAGGVEILESLPTTEGRTTSRSVWGVDTGTFVPVTAVMLSPNCWDGMEIGNKHYFFTLAGCVNEGQARGFFNEFLKDDLNAHRKVIELVGSKMKTDESTDQLSGLGFSSTQRNHVMCRVTGAFTRTIKITF